MNRSSMPPTLKTRMSSQMSKTSHTSSVGTSSTLSTQYLQSPREDGSIGGRLSTATTQSGVGRRRFKLTRQPALATYEFAIDGTDNGDFSLSATDGDLSKLNNPKAGSIAAASATGYIAESTPRLRPNRPFIFLYAGLSPENSRVVASARRPSPILQDFQIGLGDPRAVARVVSEVPGRGATHGKRHNHHHIDNVHGDIVWEDFEAVGHGEASPWSMTHAEGKRGTYAWKRTRTQVADGMSAAKLGRSGLKLVDPRRPAEGPLAVFTKQRSGANAGGILQINPHDEGPGFEEMIVMTLVCLNERDSDRNRMPMGPGYSGDEE